MVKWKILINYFREILVGLFFLFFLTSLLSSFPFPFPLPPSFPLSPFLSLYLPPSRFPLSFPSTSLLPAFPFPFPLPLSFPLSLYPSPFPFPSTLPFPSTFFSHSYFPLLLPYPSLPSFLLFLLFSPFQCFFDNPVLLFIPSYCSIMFQLEEE